MKKYISIISMFVACFAINATAVPMTAQIRDLIQQKEEKIKKLEECEGKKKGWMIAGISTIGVTAVGVAGNIILANKSSELTNEIAASKQTLDAKKDKLSELQQQAAEKERKKVEEEQKTINVDGRGAKVGGNGSAVVEEDVTEAPIVDNSKGKIGDKCGENNAGVWTEKSDGAHKCSNTDGLVMCECVVDGNVGVGATQVKVVDTGGRKILGKCIDEDIKKLNPYGWIAGHYIQVARNDNTVLKASCVNNKGEVVKCNCAADECDGTRGFERDDYGLCVKQTKVKEKAEEEAEEKQEVEEEKIEQKSSGTSASTTGSSKYNVEVDGEDYCYYDIDGSPKDENGCSVSKPGDWGVKFNYGTVSGISACSDLSGNYPEVATDQDKVTSAYTPNATSNPSGKNCYCKVTNSDFAVARWVFVVSESDASVCVDLCAVGCAGVVMASADFRRAVFGSI